MPVNLPITAGMLLSPPTGPAQLAWQWVNQSYNAGFNYANRNASQPFDWGAMAASYAVATSTAMGMAAGLGRVVAGLTARVGASGAPPSFGLTLLTRGLPWVAVASAGSANALAMRYREGIDGITVYDGSGAPAGTSVAAGRACLAQVALTRVALPVPILLIPPFVLDAARGAPGLGPLMARSRPAALGVELVVIGAFLQCALPLAVALFPQRGSIAADDLEPQFRGRKDAATGAEVTTYFYNKGL
jgi:sideroflexin-5